MDYDLEQEHGFSYQGLSDDIIVSHITKFVSDLWQIHPFCEGNTRTTAVFLIQYLRSIGFNVDNNMFTDHSWYFRNALVRANYKNALKGIDYTPVYLERFLRNLLLNENHPLHNRTLHISQAFKETEKPDIEGAKPDIASWKADIEKNFHPKIVSHIQKLREAFPGHFIFGRSDLMKVLGLKPSRASDLIKELAEHGIIEPVTGHGKGKYRFRQQE